MAASMKRRHQDLKKLMMSDEFEVFISDESAMHDFFVQFRGPSETPYEKGSWKIHVTLPQEYPFKSPSIGFMNRIYHPNIDEVSGSVCLDVINQTWSPMYDLINIFTLFLPQLLRYGNPSDPLNGDAASLMLRDPEGYKAKIEEYVRMYASTEIVLDEGGDGDNDGDGAFGVRGKSMRSKSMVSSTSTSSSLDQDEEDEMDREANDDGDDADGAYHGNDGDEDDDDCQSELSELSDLDG